MSFRPIFLFLFVFFLLELSSFCSSLVVTIPANSESCFSVDLDLNEKLFGSYRVHSGGNQDIDVRIFDPSDRVFFDQERTRENSFQLKAFESGRHKVCFSNRMSVMSEKVLYFELHHGVSTSLKSAATNEHLTPLESITVTTAEGLNGVADQVSYLKYREARHSQTSESTNSRVFWWGIMKFIALVAVSGVNITLLKRLLDRKGRT
jgi:hypothetical protein